MCSAHIEVRVAKYSTAGPALSVNGDFLDLPGRRLPGDLAPERCLLGTATGAESRGTLARSASRRGGARLRDRSAVALPPALGRQTCKGTNCASSEGPVVARLACHALNRGNVLEGPVTDRRADAGNLGCQGQVATRTSSFVRVIMGVGFGAD
jgi:hypothetical protein